MIRAIAICAATLFLSQASFAQDKSHWGGPRQDFEGAKLAQFPQTGTVFAGSPRWAWEHPIPANPAGPRAARILLTDIETLGSGDFEIRITNRAGKVIEVLDATRLSQDSKIWTATVFSTFAGVEVHGVDALNLLRFRIRALAAEGRSSSLEGIHGPNNLSNFADYAGNNSAAVLKAGRSIVRLSFSRFGDNDFCTGSLVAPDTIMTAAHCLPFPTRCKSMKVQFDYADDPTEIGCAEFIATDKDIEVGLFRLAEAPQDRDLLVFSDLEPAANTDMMIIQHPGGRTKQVSMVDCLLDKYDATDTNVVLHTCDTEPGSSGSPLLSLEGKIIGIHDHGHGMAAGSMSPNLGHRLSAVKDFVMAHIELPDEENDAPEPATNDAPQPVWTENPDTPSAELEIPQNAVPLPLPTVDPKINQVINGHDTPSDPPISGDGSSGGDD